MSSGPCVAHECDACLSEEIYGPHVIVDLTDIENRLLGHVPRCQPRVMLRQFGFRKTRHSAASSSSMPTHLNQSQFSESNAPMIRPCIGIGIRYCPLKSIRCSGATDSATYSHRSEEHTSEL